MWERKSQKKSEARNPKQIQNDQKCGSTKRIRFGFAFDLSFTFVEDFDIRILDLIVQD
jgi:hypothetical protein